MAADPSPQVKPVDDLTFAEVVNAVARCGTWGCGDCDMPAASRARVQRRCIGVPSRAEIEQRSHMASVSIARGSPAVGSAPRALRGPGSGRATALARACRTRTGRSDCRDDRSGLAPALWEVGCLTSRNLAAHGPRGVIRCDTCRARAGLRRAASVRAHCAQRARGWAWGRAAGIRRCHRAYGQ